MILKKKFLSFVLGICLCFVSLFSFTGCSLVKTNEEVVNSEVVLKVGNTSLTKKDIISAFSTYYQNNSSYFAYYEESVIEDSFYQWAIVRQMLNDMSFEALYDAETNPDGLNGEVIIYYTSDDAKKVWENVESYIYSQVSGYEESIYELAGYEKTEYPEWLKDAEKETEDSVFAPYKEPEIKIDADRKNNVVKKLTDAEIKSKISALKEYIFEYVSETNEDGEDVRVSIDDKNFIAGARNQAYADYISMLVSSAKSNGTSTDANTCLEEEIIRVYEAYYTSSITANFQSYFLNEYLTNYEDNGDKNALADEKIVKAFLEEYFTQRQINSSEAGYIETITNKDGAPLILYSYNGQNYFFSVQHILIKFTEKLDEQVKALEGNSSSNDYDSVVSDLYKENRDNLADDYTKAMLTPINEKDNFDSIVIEGGYYFYDESKKDVYDETAEIYNGYIKLEKVETAGEGEEVVVSYKDKEGNTEYDVDEVQFLATKQNILDAYNSNYAAWIELVDKKLNNQLEDYINSLKDENNDEFTKEFKEKELKKIEDMQYVFDTVENMKDSYTETEIYNKVASYLFVELQWVYSTDSLGNELSNKIGYIISNFDDENGSWVADFANGSRELTRMIDSGEIDIEALLESGDVSNMIHTIVSDYGYHMIKVENVYAVDSSIGGIDTLIDELVAAGYPISYDTSTEEGKHFVNEIVKFMKKTYVCSASNETLYNYFYDSIYEQLVGSGEDTGTYFIGLEYEWLSSFNKNGKIEYLNKLSYNELMDAMG